MAIRKPIPGTPGSEDIIATAGDSGTVIFGLEGDDNMSADVGVNDVTLDGGPGVDTLTSGGNNNTLIGGLDGDSLVSTEFADNTTMDGGAGSDTLVGGGTNDTASYVSAQAGVVVDLSTFSASDGDLLLGIENVTGSAYDDILTGDSLTSDDLGNVLQDGANVLQGGAGNDTLTGNGGNDVFKFNFTQGGGETFSFTEFFAKHGGVVVNGEVADGTKQGQFSSLYSQWLEMLVKDHGLGTDVLDLGQNAGINGTPVIENMTGEFGERESFTWTSGSAKNPVLHERWYSDTWSTGDGQDAVTSGDGNDTILDFIPGEDKLEFSGITKQQFLDFFNVDSSLNVVGDSRLDTVITIDGFDDWSVTLSGVSSFDFANDAFFS